MIQAADIRVGATFNRKHGKGWTETTINEELIAEIFSNKGVCILDFEPIILTEERLIELGAVCEELDGGAVGFYDSYSIEGIELSHVFTNMWGVIGIRIKPMTYVHDMQLVVYALTGKQIHLNNG